MPSEQPFDAVENGSSDAKGDAAVQLLLQQHRSLLLSLLVSRTMGRAMNLLMIAFSIGDMIVNRATYYVPTLAAILVVAILIARIWESERQSLSSRLAALERALGKRNQFQYDNAFTGYRFEVTGSAYKFHLVRIEPWLWLLIVIAVTALRFLYHAGVK
jgi:hypothetical protein